MKNSKTFGFLNAGLLCAALGVSLTLGTAGSAAAECYGGTDCQNKTHQQDARVEVYYTTQTVRKPVVQHVTKTREVPHKVLRQGTRKVAKVVKVPKTIYVEKTVYEEQPYSYYETVTKTETYTVPVTSYVEKQVKVPHYRKVVDHTVRYSTSMDLGSCGPCGTSTACASPCGTQATVPSYGLNENW